jgi:hypothetical protein
VQPTFQEFDAEALLIMYVINAHKELTPRLFLMYYLNVYIIVGSRCHAENSG